MISAPEFANYLLSQRLTPDAKADLSWLETLQNQSSDRLSQIPFPSTRQEEWKYTDLSGLLQFPWQLAAIPETSDRHFQDLYTAQVLLEAAHSHLTFVNGIFAPQFSDLTALPLGAIATNLSLCDPSLIPLLQQHLVTDYQDFFATLNLACFQDMALVYIPPGIKLSAPLQMLFLHSSGSNPAIAHNRCLVIVDQDSEIELVQTDAGSSTQPYFANSVTQAWLGANAKLNHTRVQKEGNQSFHLAHTHICQASHSSYTGQAIALGAKLSRHTIQLDQQGSGCESHLFGLAMIGAAQLADTHSAIAHHFPQGSSRQVHKCIVDHQAHAIFSGKIQVDRAAQMTDSAQVSRNLLLSPQARVETQPQLEILADNVKCAHGATVSQLEPEEIFYLQSRGIDASSAVSLLTFAFAAEIIEKIPVDSLRQNLNQFASSKAQNLIC